MRRNEKERDYLSYLLNNEMQILSPPLLLIPHPLKLNLTPLLQSRLNIHLQNPILRRPLPLRIKRLLLKLHLLMRPLKQILQRNRQRPLHNRHLRLNLLPPRRLRPSPSLSARPLAPRTTTTTEGTPKQIIHPVRPASHPSTPALPQELLKNTLRIVEMERAPRTPSSAASREVKRPCSPPTTAGHPAEAAGHPPRTAGGVLRTLAWLGGRGTAAQEELETVLVVGLALFGVGEDLVGLGDFLESLYGLGVIWVLVGVPFHCGFAGRWVSLLCFVLWEAGVGGWGLLVVEGRGNDGVGWDDVPVCLLDLILRGFGLDAQCRVELCFCNHARDLRPASAERVCSCVVDSKGRH